MLQFAILGGFKDECWDLRAPRCDFTYSDSNRHGPLCTKRAKHASVRRHELRISHKMAAALPCFHCDISAIWGFSLKTAAM